MGVKRNINIYNLDFKEVLSRLNASNIAILLSPILFAILLLSKNFREVATPFMLGVIFAYILTPIVNFLSNKLKFPRLLSIFLIFAVFVFLIIFLLNKTIVLTNQEIGQLTEETQDINKFLNRNINSFPWWSHDMLQYLADSLKTLPRTIRSFALPVLKNTFETIILLFAFFATIFYLLKDAPRIIKFLKKSQLYTEIHQTIQSYFRGQLILIAVMTTFTWIFLRILGIKYAFLLSVFTGFAEIVPYVGPILAATIAILVTLLTDSMAFGYPPFGTAIFVALGYFFLRQFEDFFIIPQVIGRSVELHPLVILFTVLLAGKLYGLFGLLFGVPFIASYKIVLEYVLEKKEV